jgi:hypothetical protein
MLNLGEIRDQRQNEYGAAQTALRTTIFCRISFFSGQVTSLNEGYHIRKLGIISTQKLKKTAIFEAVPIVAKPKSNDSTGLVQRNSTSFYAENRMRETTIHAPARSDC